ncbi:hypothetical protein HDU84_004784 [Entophlyctis sp. JEL0112]|nr:hypothetical protein HDU84_004784 [Entophlyctis sp. JEL0112]
MGNYIADISRIFNSRGQRIYDAISGILGTFLVLIALIYAGVRGHKVATSLPVTFRTTQQPKKLPIDYIDDLFPISTPSATFEFPAVTVCADDPAATIVVGSCFRTTTATATSCDAAGIITGNLAVEGNSLSCATLNQLPGSLLEATTADDTLTVNVGVSGTRAGYHDGVVVYLHDQSLSSYDNMFNITFDNYFTAATYTVGEIALRKVLSIDLFGDYTIYYESKVSYLGINTSQNTSIPSPVVLELKYPRLEVVYEKEYMVLDMVSVQLVGGVVYIVPLVLLRFDRYTDVKGKRPNNYESFSGY